MKQILLIDDEPNFLDAMQRHFRPYRQQWTLTCASDGNKAMALVRNHPFDLVVTDILMPEKEGLETIMELRKGYPRIKIVAISGGGCLVGKNVLHWAQRLGAHRTLEKPFEPQVLMSMVDDLLATPPNDDSACLASAGRNEANPVCR